MKFDALVQQLEVNPAHTSLAVQPDLNPDIFQAAAIEQATLGSVTFIEGTSYAQKLTQTQASAVILPQLLNLQQTATQQGIAWVSTPQPRLLFAQALALFYQPWMIAPGIHPTAVIDETAQVGTAVAIGAYVVIQAGVKVGDGVCIHPHTTLYAAAEIGAHTILHAHCVIHERTVVGEDCVIHSGAVIGAEGFGFVPTAQGWVKMPQSGRTVLEDGVEVGCNTTIDRPAVGETKIGRGTKIDNLVQVGHGCQIGQHCVLVSQVGLAGGVQVGDHVVLAGQAGVSEKLKIGAGAIVSAKAGVIQNVAAGETVSGFPAMPHGLWLRTSVLLRRLPTLWQRQERCATTQSVPESGAEKHQGRSVQAGRGVSN
jgi:UDP-3-O-[3-hydroxymyristoyl] glucosamine N-acyltransferase